MFPEWYYTLLWEKGYLSSDHWQAGLDFWLHDEPFWFFVGTVAAAVLLVLVYRRGERVLSFLDRFALRMIAWSLAGSLITVLVVRIYSAPCFTIGQTFQLAYDLTLKQVESVAPHPAIQVPVDFHYLDSERVKALYNEIEQELVEQQRTVGSTGTMSGKVGGKAGAVEAEIGGSKQQNSSSTYQRLEFSPERKCVELMNYVLKGNESKYLTTSDDWLRRRQAANFQAQYSEILKRMLSGTPGASPILPVDTTKNPTKQEQEAAALQLEAFTGQLKSELAALDGLVFVEGDYAISRSSQGAVILVENFSESPRIAFRITASAAPGLDGITPSGRAHLRVFGTVVRPLVGNGPIEVRAIAVF